MKLENIFADGPDLRVMIVNIKVYSFTVLTSWQLGFQVAHVLWFVSFCGFWGIKKCDNATALCLLCNFEHELTLFTNFTVVCIIISWQKADFEIKMAIEFSANFPTLQKMIYIFSHTYCDFSTNPDLISAKFLAKTAHLYWQIFSRNVHTCILW